MSRKRIIPGPILMVITILVVTGFQVYWLKDNYNREKRSLQIKTNVAFHETVRDLQAVKLKWNDSFSDSLHKMKRVLIEDDLRRTKLLPKRQVITLMNAVRDKVKDSLGPTIDSTVLISLEKGKDRVGGTPIRFEKGWRVIGKLLRFF